MEKELEDLLNKYSQDNRCETPDFILAQYLRGCIEVYELALKRNITWHGWKTLDEKLNGDSPLT